MCLYSSGMPCSDRSHLVIEVNSSPPNPGSGMESALLRAYGHDTCWRDVISLVRE